MPGRRSLLTALLLTAFGYEARAQFVPGPFPVPGPVVAPGLPVLVPNGIGFDYRGRRLRVSGFFNSGGYSYGILPVAGYYPGFAPVAPYPIPTAGFVDSRVSVHMVAPTVTVAPRPVLEAPLDLSGVDLDRSPSPLHEFEGKPRLVPRDVPPPIIKRDEEKPKIVPPPLKEEKKAPPVEDVNPLAEGLKAFKEEEFGLAALRFEQAAVAAPGKAQPWFLLAQTLVAQGKFRDAVAAIARGLKMDPDFPVSDFRPREDLYKGIDAEYLRHRKMLDDATKADPDNGAFVFLQGYLEWFEGRRPEARKLFTRARTLLADPFVADRFLKAEKFVGLK